MPKDDDDFGDFGHNSGHFKRHRKINSRSNDWLGSSLVADAGIDEVTESIDRYGKTIQKYKNIKTKMTTTILLLNTYEEDDPYTWRH